MGMKGEIMNTVKSWDLRNFNKNEKEGTVAVQISKSKKLDGHSYKQWLKSLVKAKGSDPSIQKKSELSQSEVNITEPNSSNEDETTNADSSFSQSQRERADFLLRRVRYSGHAEKSNSSNHATQTKLQKRKNISKSQCNLDESKLQEKFAHSVADECKSTTTNFVEYWVPVRLSNVQTEQYCGSLFSNSSVLSSCLKHDPTEILHEILVSTRKCCDHPYLVDWSLRTSLIQGIPEPEQLDAEIKLSSKLLLLYKILLEISKRGLRVLILYQSLGGSGPISTGDILDDIIHEKFGRDSFVRIGGGISRSKKRAVLNTFNDKGSGKFVCLMETRACLPSIKLTSMDTVIFFNSDWDPMNDLRALRKINLDSQFEEVKVFRLYSAYTVEEKVLMLTKQGTTPEGNIVNIKQSTCHGLLTWGAYYLFKRLDEFHNFSTSDTHSIISYGDSFVEDVFLELSVLLPNNDKNNVRTNNSFILEAQQIGGIYPRNISLLGEVEYPFMDNCSLVEEMTVKEPPYVFWIKLLEGRNPRWKYFSSQSPRTRKSVQRFDHLLEASVSAYKKCRTEARSTVCQVPAIMRRARNERQSRDKERKLPESDRREKPTSWINQQGKAAALTIRQTPMLGNPSSTECYSLLPPDDHDQMPSSTTIQNDHQQETTCPSFQTQAARYPFVEDSVRRSESSLDHSIAEVPLQTAHIASNMTERREPIATSQTSVSLTSLNCQPPEASQVTDSEVLQSVCKALQIELEKLQKQKTEFLKQHEDMKLQAKMACEKEIDQIHKKYEMVLHNAEMAFMKEKEVLETRYNKVFINKSLAEAMIQRENSKNATLSQVTTDCLMEEVSQLIFQWPRSSTVTRPEQVAENLPISSLAGCSVIQELNQESASERIASRANQSCLSPCATLPYPVASSEVACCQPDVRKSCNITNQASLDARPDQHLANPCMAEPQLMPSGGLDCSLPVQRTSGRREMYPETWLKTGSPSIRPSQQRIIELSAVKSTNAETTLAPREASARQGMTGLSMDLTSSVQLPQASLDLRRSASPLGQMHNLPITFSGNLQAGCQIRAPAPHFRHMPHPLPYTAPKLSSQGPGIIFSSVSLRQVTSNVQTRQSPGCSKSSPARLPLRKY